MAQAPNPLKQFFRQPALYLRLPSGGQFWPQGTLEMPPNNEIPILPMTAMDEITYRTPDALFNGAAIVNVIQSCAPSVKNAWKAPGTDLNALLIAIRVASFGSDMDIETDCPACEHHGEFTLNLSSVLESMPKPNFNNSIKHGDLEIYFKPLDYQTQNQINMKQFEQQQILVKLPTSEVPEDQKIKLLNQALDEITKLTLNAIQQSIAGIRTPQMFVTESEHIEEFLKNCDSGLFNKIRDRAIELRTSSELKPMKVKCTNCDHEYEQTITLDNVSFFEVAS